MEIISGKNDLSHLKYPIQQFAPLEDIIFVDIETTGFSPKTSKLYLIGCMYFEKESVCYRQFFADQYDDEAKIMSAFTEFVNHFSFIIHFNGNNFDIPYLEYKAKKYDLSLNFSTKTGLDIYKRIAPFRHFLQLPNCKQKTVETFLKLSREDKYSGGDLIGIYHSYVKDNDAEKKKLLMLHNYEDVIGMLDILPILSYCDLLSNNYTVQANNSSSYFDVVGNEVHELIVELYIINSLPIRITAMFDKCYFSGFENKGVLRVPIIKKELKYFYAGYKDYYYLPDEDMALHKSVASFVDKNHRIQAKANNCYTRKNGVFLPQWSEFRQPYFKENYESKETFFEYTSDLKNNSEFLSKYCNEVLHHMIFDSSKGDK